MTRFCLGTVTGMIGSFSILDPVRAHQLSLVVLVRPLSLQRPVCVAIMAFIVYTFFSHRLDSIINQIEGMGVSIVSAKREGWK